MKTAGEYPKLGRIYNRKELSEIPPPTPLIENWLDLRTAVLVVGATGTNKTFMLLDWACSVVTGVDWLGNAIEVKGCTVIYVVGEGGSGLDSRIAAWETKHNMDVPPDRLLLLMRPESINDPNLWEELTELAIEVDARLVILDTFSALAPDADETTEAAKVIANMTSLVMAIDGVVALAHHTGWGSLHRSRGGSQFESNADGTILLRKLETGPDVDNSIVEVLRKKNKDGPEGHRIWIQREDVPPSCVLAARDEPGRKTVNPHIRNAIESVLKNVDRFTLTRNNVVDAIGGDKSKTWQMLARLIDDEVQIVEDSRKRPEGNRMVKRDVLAWTDPERVRLRLMGKATPLEGSEELRTPPDDVGGVDDDDDANG